MKRKKKKKRPKAGKQQVFRDLARLVGKNEYLKLKDASLLPESVKPYAGGRSKTVVIAASGCRYDASASMGTLAPSGTIYLLRNYRYCEHDRQRHFNADDYVFWKDGSSNLWEAYSTDSPDHYQLVVNTTTVDDVWNSFHLPKADNGTLDDFRREGAYINFRDPCPGFDDDEPNQ